MSVLNLRLPTDLHDDLKDMARQQGVSMNQFALLAVAEKLAVLRWRDIGGRHEAGLTAMHTRAGRGSRERFLEVLSKSGDNSPQPGDELPAGYQP